MYLKVPYSNNVGDKKYATQEEIEQALNELPIPENLRGGLVVDMDLNYPCVEFPDGTSHSDFKAVQKAFNDAGFEVS